MSPRTTKSYLTPPPSYILHSQVLKIYDNIWQWHCSNGSTWSFWYYMSEHFIISYVIYVIHIMYGPTSRTLLYGLQLNRNNTWHQCPCNCNFSKLAQLASVINLISPSCQIDTFFVKLFLSKRTTYMRKKRPSKLDERHGIFLHFLIILSFPISF